MCYNAPSVAAGCLQRRLCDRRHGDCPDLAKSAIYSTVVQHKTSTRDRMNKLQTVLRCPFGIYKTLVPRGDGLADERHDIEIPQTLKTPQLPPAHPPFPLGPGDIGGRRTCPPNRSSRSFWDAGMPWGRAVRGCPSSWPSPCAWCARLDHGSMAPWIHGPLGTARRVRLPGNPEACTLCMPCFCRGPGLLHTLYFTGSHSEAFRPFLFPPLSACWVQVAGQKGLRIIFACVRVLSEVLSLQW
jgi:hypothetical protein